MNFMKKIVMIFTVILLLELLIIQIAIAREYAYLFSQSTKFIKIDVENDKIVNLGNLWWQKIFDVGAVQTDPERKLIFINTEKAFLQGLDKPPYAGIMVLNADHKGEIRFVNRINIGVEKIEPSGVIGPYISGLGFSPDGKKIYISWSDEEKEGMTGIFDAKTGSKLFEIPKNWAGVDKCFGADGKRLIVPWGREFLIYDNDNYNIINRINYYEKVGNPKFFSKTISSVANCKAVIVEYKERPENNKAPGKIYIFDLEKEKVITQIDTDFRGEYKLVKKGEQLWIDETKDIPIVEDGKVVGVQREKVGRLHMYNVQSGKESKVLNLPEGGKGYWLSPDNEKLYYFGNQLLTIIDLEKLKILKTLEIPFENAYMVFLNE